MSVLPFPCIVETLGPDGEWDPHAQGSSVEWLRERMAEARSFESVTEVRLIAMPSREVLEEAKWLT